MRKRKPLQPQAPKCYPSKARSYLLSLGNVLFPFYNPAFAIGIGLIYWIVTWEFQTLVSQLRDLLAARSTRSASGTSLWSVLPCMPIYLIQAMIASISLTILLGGLYAILIWYVDAVERPGFRRYATKFVVGTAHFLAHLTAMFTLSLLVVTLEQPDDADHREPARCRSTHRATNRRPSSATPSRSRWSRCKRQDASSASARRRTRPAASPVRQLVGFMSYPILMIVLGALVGGSLWGLYWVLTGLFGRMHAEDAFAALGSRTTRTSCGSSSSATG